MKNRTTKPRFGKKDLRKSVKYFTIKGGQGQPDVAVKVQNVAPTGAAAASTVAPTSSVLSNFFFQTDKITTQPNSDPSLREAGIMHMTHAKGINVVRGFGTGIFNLFGAKGFDTVIFDEARTEALAEITKKMEEGGIKKLCNLRMDADSSNPAMFVLSIYGTALK
jgi:uncharacterized protein YbjQ (UPF0145 family)